MSMSPRLLRPRESFTPKSISGLALWLDASDASTLFQNSDGTTPATTAGDPVGYWADKSGNNRHATQSTAASRPVVGTVNGRKALAFDGSDDRLQTAAFPSALNQPVTVLCVHRFSSADTTQTVFDGRANRFFYGPDTSSEVKAQTLTAANILTGDKFSALSTRLATVAYNGASSAIYQAGALVGAGLIDSGTLDGLTVGNIRGVPSPLVSVYGLNGSIEELIVYSRALSTAERRKVEVYLARRWGITIAPQVSDPDAQDWVNRVYANGGTVSTATASAVNTFCEAIAAANIRDRFYRLNLFAGTGLNACLVPLYRGPSLGGTQYGNTTDTNNAFVGVGTDYAETGAGGGLTGNGTSKYLNTGLAISALPDQRYGHMAAYNVGFPQIHTASRWIMGCGNSSGTVLNWLNVHSAPQSPTSQYRRVNWSKGSYVVTNTSETGDVLFAVSRTAAGEDFAYQNAEKTALLAGPLSTTMTEPIFVFAQNGAGTPSGHYDRAVAAYSIGNGLTEAEMTTYRSVLASFMASMGRVST